MLEVEAYGVPDSVIGAVRRVSGVRSVAVDTHGHSQVLLVQADPGVEGAPDGRGLLRGTPVGRVATREPTLEDADVELVGSQS